MAHDEMLDEGDLFNVLVRLSRKGEHASISRSACVGQDDFA